MAQIVPLKVEAFILKLAQNRTPSLMNLSTRGLCQGQRFCVKRAKRRKIQQITYFFNFKGLDAFFSGGSGFL